MLSSDVEKCEISSQF